jgi:thymidylate kinase
LFVAIEGTEGAGKSTIRRLLFASLSAASPSAASPSAVSPSAASPSTGQGDVLAVQGQSYLAPAHAKIITYAKFRGTTYPADVLTAATVADKEILCERVIRPHQPGRTIVADRWILSDAVYNQALFGVPMETTMRAFAASRVLSPDVIILVDTAPGLAWQRILSRRPAHPHRWDSAAMLETLHELFLTACGWLPEEKILRLPNDGTPEQAIDLVLRGLRARGLAAVRSCRTEGR